MAFHKFDPRAFLENQDRGGTPAKVAKPAKVGSGTLDKTGAFATFASFAASPPDIRNPASPVGEPIPAAWSDAEKERAAIAEHDGGAPRAWAEALARLDSARPPGDVPLRRWRQFIDDAGRFLDGKWADQAIKLGWAPLDLFGCDRKRPFARIDHAGLIWLLNRNKLVMLSAGTAAIKSPSGARLTYRPRPRAMGEIALPWELVP